MYSNVVIYRSNDEYANMSCRKDYIVYKLIEYFIRNTIPMLGWGSLCSNLHGMDSARCWEQSFEELKPLKNTELIIMFMKPV